MCSSDLLDYLSTLENRPDGKLILVTAMALTAGREHDLSPSAGIDVVGEIQPALAPAAEFKIGHCEKLGVEQRTVKHPVLDRDVEALADSVERCGRTRAVLARQILPRLHQA